MEKAAGTAFVLWGMGLLVLAITALAWLRGFLADRRERARMAKAEATGRNIPPSLHPVIDTQLCISSAACVKACPEQDVLGLIAGAGRLVHGASCVGHGLCAAECPVGAIRLVFGTAERGQDIPHVTGNFETSRAGVYIAGELGGMGLIRNAIRQGVGAARHAVQNLGGGRGGDEAVDVLVVGAGPAGLGAALACKEAGATFRVVDQGRVGGTVASYPRHKVVMTAPIQVPLYGTIHRAEITKEELLATWQRIIDETRLQVETGVKLTGLDGHDGDFTAQTSAGAVRARKVILAIGRRGSPRKLGVPGEDLPHVTYELTHAEQYKGCRVVVVGGGDSALEAACQLVEEAGATVHLVHRGDGFRGKEKNVAHAAALQKAGRLGILLKANTASIAPGKFDVVTTAGPRTLDADYVIILVGGELPTALLNAMGIRFDRWFGKAPEGVKPIAAVGTGQGAQVTVLDRWLAPFLFVAGTIGLAWLAARGWDYYRVPMVDRAEHPDHAMLKPSGFLGHGIGVVATLVMFTNYLYAARKRMGVMRRLGTMKGWLNVHVVVGLLAPAYIALHATFASKNLVATVSYWAVGAVVVTGIIGRYIYGRVAGALNKAGNVAGIKRLMRSWRLLHIVLAVVMGVVVVVHVGLSLLFGYRWIFS